jgi:hypothetical protein
MMTIDISILCNKHSSFMGKIQALQAMIMNLCKKEKAIQFGFVRYF